MELFDQHINELAKKLKESSSDTLEADQIQE